jgi:hypothetical protein
VGGQPIRQMVDNVIGDSTALAIGLCNEQFGGRVAMAWPGHFGAFSG